MIHDFLQGTIVILIIQSAINNPWKQRAMFVCMFDFRTFV